MYKRQLVLAAPDLRRRVGLSRRRGDMLCGVHAAEQADTAGGHAA